MKDSSLTQTKQQAYTLFQIEKKSIEEIADLKKISIDTVKGKETRELCPLISEKGYLGDAANTGLPMDWSRLDIPAKRIDIIRRAKKNAVSSNVKVKTRKH